MSPGYCPKVPSRSRIGPDGRVQVTSKPPPKTAPIIKQGCDPNPAMRLHDPAILDSTSSDDSQPEMTTRKKRKAKGIFDSTTSDESESQVTNTKKGTEMKKARVKLSTTTSESDVLTDKMSKKKKKKKVKKGKLAKKTSIIESSKTTLLVDNDEFISMFPEEDVATVEAAHPAEKEDVGKDQAEPKSEKKKKHKVNQEIEVISGGKKKKKTKEGNVNEAEVEVKEEVESATEEAPTAEEEEQETDEVKLEERKRWKHACRSRVLVSKIPSGITEAELRLLNESILGIERPEFDSSHAYLVFANEDVATDVLPRLQFSDVAGKLSFEKCKTSTPIDRAVSHGHTEGEVNECWLRVSNMAYNSTRKDIHSIFEAANHVRIVQPLGVAFVMFDTPEETRRAFDRSRCTTLKNSELLVVYARMKTEQLVLWMKKMAGDRVKVEK